MSTDPALLSSLIVPPLDAYLTAKPDEPTWTVQGGDPLGAPLLQVWAVFARIQAGVITPGAVDGVFSKLLEAANKHPPENDREREGLLLRATQTEEVSWDFLDYLAGRIVAEDAKPAAENSLDEKARLDLHDLRVRTAQKLSNTRCELKELSEALEAAQYDNVEALTYLDETLEALRKVGAVIEPRRLFRRD